MFIEYLNETLCFVIAFVIGLSIYKTMTPFYKALFWQLLCWIVIYLISHIVTKYQKWQDLPRNNQWVFNLSIFIETSLLALAAYLYFKDKLKQRMIILLYALFMGIYLASVYIKGFNAFLKYAFISECFIILILYTRILYSHFYINIKVSSPEFWISTGILVFFAGNLPYFLLFDYLNSNHPKLSLLFFNIITDVLANVRYLLLAVGFWILRRSNLNQALPNVTI